MLELKYNWLDWQERECRMARKEGYTQGKLLSLIDMVKRTIRREAQYQRTLQRGKTVPENLQELHELYMEALEQEKFREVVNFSKKYPSLSREQLAKRILWESEYWFW